jgi:hypothetical protein
MGYSQSIQTLEARRAEGLLQDLEQGQGCVWTVEPGVRPSDFAYKIREALFIARQHPQRYPALADAQQRFTIEVLNNRQVQARLKRGVTTGAIISGVPSPLPAQGLETVEKGSGTLMGPQTAESIVQYWLNNQPSNASMLFPQAYLTGSDKLTLHRFLSQHHWLFFEAQDGAITVQPHQADLAEFAWSPEPEEEPELEGPGS